jgi:hypothetical protein
MIDGQDSSTKLGKSTIKIFLKGKLIAQIHLGFGRKILSVGFFQERLSMAYGQVDEICKVFGFVQENSSIADGRIDEISEVFQLPKKNVDR